MQTRKTVFHRNWISWYLDLGLPSLQNWEINFCCLNNPHYGIWLWWSEQTKAPDWCKSNFPTPSPSSQMPSLQRIPPQYSINIEMLELSVSLTLLLFLVQTMYHFLTRDVIHILCLPFIVGLTSVQFSSVAQSCPTLCNLMNRSTPGLPVHHQLPEFTQTHVHQVSDAIQPSHPLLSPSPPAPNPSQHRNSKASWWKWKRRVKKLA